MSVMSLYRRLTALHESAILMIISMLLLSWYAVSDCRLYCYTLLVRLPAEPRDQMSFLYTDRKIGPNVSVDDSC